MLQTLALRKVSVWEIESEGGPGYSLEMGTGQEQMKTDGILILSSKAVMGTRSLWEGKLMSSVSLKLSFRSMWMPKTKRIVQPRAQKRVVGWR